MMVKNLKLPQMFSDRLRLPPITRNVGYVLCAALVALTLFIGIPDRQAIPYYHMIDNEDYEAFIWIKDHVDGEYNKAILDPWKATAFIAITGKKVYSRIHAFPKDTDKEAYAFLDGGAADTAFLRENKISLVYTRSGTSNPDLVEVRKYIYTLKEAPQGE